MVIEIEATTLQPGYKQTEVGVIPDDWEAKTFGEVITGFTSGATPLRSQIDFYKGNIRWITSRELSYNVIMDTIEKVSTEAVSKTNLRLLPKGTFLIAITGMEAEGTRGRCGIIGAEATTNQHCMALFPTKELSTHYLFQYYMYKGKALALEYCQGTKQQDYTSKTVKLLPILLPPTILEQQAIATALSDVDALITSLDRLIAKKQAIKQATMQQLLTGKTRLPGFSGEWEHKKLGDVAEAIMGGGTPSRSNPIYWGGNIPWVTVKDFATFDPYFSQESITETGLQNSASNLVKKGTIITSTRMAIGKAVIYKVNVSINQDLKAIILKKNIDTLFTFYWFEQNTKNIEDLGSGSTVKGISLSDLKNVSFFKPPTKAEQQAIAGVLSDMDAEIVALEQRRDKTRMLKQGMMQELLTGKTRLI